jgi:heterotetrameric sarcosine oxidase gamma subunit
MPVFAAEALDLVQIGVRRGAAAEFAAALGCTPPMPGQVSRAIGCDMLWLQPGTYLLAAPRGAMPSLDALAPFAALVEQSDGRSAFTLSGPRAREVLAKGCRLDFHPRVFAPGRAAGAIFAHVNAVIQQTSDQPEFRIIVLSSFARHIAEFLAHATQSA